ncbi:Zinc finger (RING finger) containing protein [Novymonas esmeraldas]|uniref:Zinc finger (RING finger) containing protein n=1 Tax=Novymonas esmeraldas TaxID=1808958 RepID=A0AAW0F3Q7_9TRYP
MSSAGASNGMDRLVRRIPAADAVSRTGALWEAVKQRRAEDGPLPLSTYAELLQYTARRILVRLEDGHVDGDTWGSYVDFATQALFAHGTADMPSYLAILERILKAVLVFPVEPEPLLKEYLHCAVAQGAQRSSAVSAYASAHPVDDVPPLEKAPDLEYNDALVACIPARPVTEVMKVLASLPTRLTFAHRHAVVHLGLCNPLPIPGCAYVSTGYSCDTCRLRGIRVGFQAMVYDGDAEDATAAGVAAAAAAAPAATAPVVPAASVVHRSGRSVRSDAQISRKLSYGFDVCMACAVFFYGQQRENLLSLLHPPHRPYALGHAAGVVILSSRCRWRRHSLCLAGACGMRPLSRGSSAASSSRKVSSVSPIVTATAVKENSSDFSERTACCSSGSSASDEALVAATRIIVKRPPTRPPLRRSSVSDSVSASPPLPPTTRCVAGAGLVACLRVGLAPYGARPIAWVLGDAERGVEVGQVDELLERRLGPRSGWRSRVSVSRAVQLPSRAPPAAAAATTSIAVSEAWPFARSDEAEAGGAGAAAAAAAACDTAATPSPALPKTAEVVHPLHRDGAPLESAVKLPRVLSTGNPLCGAAADEKDNTDADDDEDEGDTCAICLCPFDGGNPMIETTCHHWFHVSCIEEYTRTASDACPLCRAAQALPDMSRAAALSKNVYRLEVALTEDECSWPYIDVCVGAVLTRDGNYHNATSVAAAQCVRLFPDQLREAGAQTVEA